MKRAVRLSVQGLSRVFVDGGREVVALEDVDIDVHDGEFVALVGPSGCGKSTLLSILAGLDHATGGRVLLDGHPIDAPSAERGMVFQRDCLFPWLTVLENIRFVMQLQVGKGSGSHAEQMIDRSRGLLDAVGLSKFADAYPSQLSGGMRQRASIARALLFQPSILLMDEPFGALDAQTREDMQDLLLGLCARHKTTVLFVTHDVEEAVYLADRAIVLSAHPGRVAAEVAIDLPRPRAFEMKLSPRFHELRAAVLRALHREAVAAGG